MFISYRLFKEAMAKAQEDTEFRIYSVQRHEDLLRRFYELETRIEKLEHPEGAPVCESIGKVVKKK